MSQIEEDATRTLQALVVLDDQAEADGATMSYFDGETLTGATDIPAARLNRAVEFLEQRGLVDVLRVMGTAPYLFGDVRPTTSGRHVLETVTEKVTPRSSDSPSGHVRQGVEVFLVHGRDDAAREKVARMLSDFELEVVILAEQPNEGRTVIEKFEQNALDVGFAVVLLTADDVGYYVGDDPSTARYRARQNVILEPGYFLAALGRNRVSALIAPSVEQPSDIHGLVYIPLDPEAAWRLLLARELKAAGLDVDMNRLV